MLTLQVEFDRFLQAQAEIAPKAAIYIRSVPGGCLLSAADSSKNTVVSSLAPNTENETIEILRGKGIEARRGRWWTGAEPQPDGEVETTAYVAAVSYLSSDACPGVWIDAFGSPPTEIQALRGMYEEFRETGELGDVAFEEFVRLAKPTVAIVSPAEVQRYVAQKSESGC